MLILDKQKAVEHMLAIAAANPVVIPEDGLSRFKGRVRQRVATYERRTSAEASPERRAERRSVPLQPAGGAPLV